MKIPSRRTLFQYVIAIVLGCLLLGYISLGVKALNNRDPAAVTGLAKSLFSPPSEFKLICIDNVQYFAASAVFRPRLEDYTTITPHMKRDGSLYTCNINTHTVEAADVP